MKYEKLPFTDIEVSKICLGTMTFGQQNTQEEAFEQLDYALAQGVNFLDTAELYSVPPKAETQGSTERMIGHWLRARNNRDQVVLATKIAGPSAVAAHIREGKSFANHQNITEAVDGSLKRLQTDYIDLYQIHWPARPTNFFGQLAYDPQTDEPYWTPILETLEALNQQVKAGKIRYIGVSNETPWGVAEYLRISGAHQLPRILTIQNAYSLLNRSYEVGLAEFAHREQVKLLPYSPLGFGVLSGKYLNNQKPKGGRITLFPEYARYLTENGQRSTEAYVNLAREHGLDPAQMALAFVNQRPFVLSNIIGATTMAQLKDNIASIDVELPEGVLSGIEAIHRQYTYPCP